MAHPQSLADRGRRKRKRASAVEVVCAVGQLRDLSDEARIGEIGPGDHFAPAWQQGGGDAVVEADGDICIRRPPQSLLDRREDNAGGIAANAEKVYPVLAFEKLVVAHLEEPLKDDVEPKSHL